MASATLSRVVLACVFSLVLYQVADAAQCYKSFTKDDYPNCDLVSPNYAVHWKLNGDNVTFALDVDEVPTGWIGFGPSEAGGMKGADIWIVKQNNAGGWLIMDMHSDKIGPPILDTKQDVSLVGTPVTTSNSIAAVLTRSLKSCDVSDLSILKNVTTPFIWAHAPEVGYHGPTTRGTAMLHLELAETTKAPTGLEVYDMTMPGITVPTNHTTYLCRTYKLPSDNKYQVVSLDFNVSSALVHHLVMYGCATPPKAKLGELYECPNMPAECSQFTFAWAPGIDSWVAPAEAGIPMDQYYALQVHYNNPTGVKDQKDFSGIQIHYTTQLRKYDIGVLMLGQTRFEIPPGEANYSVPPAVCPSECTKSFTGPLTIIKHAFHMHTLGLGIHTQVVRDGKELRPLGSRARWDFNFQRFDEPNPGTNMLMPGDSLITTCTFDSSKKNTSTTFGESTDDEMCLDFLLYYPAQKASVCIPWGPGGLAGCYNSVEFSTWIENLQKGMNMTRAMPPASPPPAPKSNDATQNGTGSAPSREEVFAQLALQAGFLLQFNQSEYEPGTGFVPYDVPGGCPAFLSAADNGSAAGVTPAGPAPRGSSGAMAAVGLQAVLGWAVAVLAAVLAVLQ